MILQCPSCDARFLVNDALIPLEGRDVRCGRCKNTWFVTPSPIPMEGMPAPARKDEPVFADFDHALASATADEADDMAMSAARGATLPMVQAQAFAAKRAILPTLGLCIVTMIVALMAHYPGWKSAPVAGAIYRALGYADTKGIALADVVLSRVEGEGSTQFLLSGNLLNREDHEAVLPSIRVRLLDRDGKVVWATTADLDITLTPREIFPFRLTEVRTAFADRVEQVQVDLGNGYELMVR